MRIPLERKVGAVPHRLLPKRRTRRTGPRDTERLTNWDFQRASVRLWRKTATPAKTSSAESIHTRQSRETSVAWEEGMRKKALPRLEPQEDVSCEDTRLRSVVQERLILNHRMT